MAENESLYNGIFYAYQREGALRSARVVLSHLHAALKVGTVLDVGCGAGAWLKAHLEAGADAVLGVDGNYLDPALLVIDQSLFQTADIAQWFDLGRRFDLVECLEVGEHVPSVASATLVDNLVRHGPVVLFSAAPPGQGGLGHINEQPPDFWRDLFAEHGYQAFDFVRPAVRGASEVEWWYRYNTLLFVAGSEIGGLPLAVANTRLPADRRVPDLSPPLMRIRKLVLRLLPHDAVSRLAALKHRRFVRALERVGTPKASEV